MSEKLPKKKSEIKKLIHNYVKEYTEKFGLQDWSIYIEFEKCSNENHVAEIVAKGCYQRAWITFDLDMLRNRSEEAISKTVKHEILHIFDSPFTDTMEILGKMLTPKQYEIYEVIYLQACEKMVRGLEKAFDNE